MTPRDRILLFDWRDGGHHPLYVRRFVEALAGIDTIVAAPHSVVAQMPEGVETIDLGAPRPAGGMSPAQTSALGRQELAILETVAADSGATRLVHLYADAVLRQWPRSSVRLPPTTICVFFSAKHYPRAYSSPLTARERVREERTELALRLWRRRPEAYSILAMDDENARRWDGRVPAFWLPEPPVPTLAARPATKEGAVLYGALAPHKGFHALVSALSLPPSPSYPITIAGPVRADFASEFELLCSNLRARNVDLRTRLRHHDEHEGLAVLAAASCALLPYHRHTGMSRVLLESASVGTPVVASDFGLLGQLVRSFGLGIVVRPEHAANLRSGLDALCGRPPDGAQSRRLADFALRYETRAFAEIVRRATGLGTPEGQPRSTSSAKASE